MPVGSRQQIHDFLGLKRIALIGASRDEKSYSRAILKEFRRVGFDMIPVNPAAREIEGLPCAACIADVAPAVAGALIVTAPAAGEPRVRECLEAGIKFIWVRGKPGRSSLSREIVAQCAERGVLLIEGYCPLMFLPDTLFFHRLHGFFSRLGGHYPR
jgi:uncharacterized protein